MGSYISLAFDADAVKKPIGRRFKSFPRYFFSELLLDLQTKNHTT